MGTDISDAFETSEWLQSSEERCVSYSFSMRLLRNNSNCAHVLIRDKEMNKFLSNPFKKQANVQIATEWQRNLENQIYIVKDYILINYSNKLVK